MGLHIRGGKIDNLNATHGWTEPIVVLLFKAMIPGSVSEWQDIGCLQFTPEYPNALTLENVGTDLGQCLVTALDLWRRPCLRYMRESLGGQFYLL